MDIRKKAVGVIAAAALLACGALGGSVLSASGASSTNAAPTARGGSNTDPAHEKAESPARAAAEASGKFPGRGGKFVPNTSPAHEKAESAARAAQENAGQFPTVP